MQLGKLGIFYFVQNLSAAQLKELTQRCEQLGYSALWYPEGRGAESLSMGSFLLSQSRSLIVASGIANVYARDPCAMKWGQHQLARLYGDRFILGLGVSHAQMVEGLRGHAYRKPVPVMREFLDGMDQAAGLAAPLAFRPPAVLAALGPLMTALARERTDGAHPYNVTPEHSALAREIVGPDKWVCTEQKVCVTKNASQARGVARKIMKPYLDFPHYRNNWLRLGFQESDFAGEGSDRFLDAMVAWGNAATVRRRIQEHWDAGANHVCIQPLRADGGAVPDYDAMAELAG